MKLKMVSLGVFMAVMATFAILQTYAVSTTSANSFLVTGPITSATHQLGGKVIYYTQKGWIRFAPFINVSAQNTISKKIYTAHTDKSGNYSLTLPSTTYKVWASDSRGTRFSPTVVNINLATDAAHVNFAGLVSN